MSNLNFNFEAKMRMLPTEYAPGLMLQYMAMPYSLADFNYVVAHSLQRTGQDNNMASAIRTLKNSLE